MKHLMLVLILVGSISGSFFQTSATGVFLNKQKWRNIPPGEDRNVRYTLVPLKPQSQQECGRCRGLTE